MSPRARPALEVILWITAVVGLMGIGLVVGGIAVVKAMGMAFSPTPVSTSLVGTEVLVVAAAPTLVVTATPAVPTATVAASETPVVTRVRVSASATFTPSPLPSPTRTSATPTATFSPQPNVSPTATATVSPSPTGTATDVPPTATDTPSPSPTASATTAPAMVSGRLVRSGTPVGSGAVLALEDSASQIAATQAIGPSGVFSFAGIAPSSEGYQVTFSQGLNEQFDVDQVMSWVWVGPIALSGGAQINIGDLEIGLLGLEHIRPEPQSSVSRASISASTPLEFEWTTYPQAEHYWLDLMRADGQTIVWQSALITANSVAFDGVLPDGSALGPGDYVWAVGAQRQAGSYDLIVYGYLAALEVMP